MYLIAGTLSALSFLDHTQLGAQLELYRGQNCVKPGLSVAVFLSTCAELRPVRSCQAIPAIPVSLPICPVNLDIL